MGLHIRGLSTGQRDKEVPPWRCGKEEIFIFCVSFFFSFHFIADFAASFNLATYQDGTWGTIKGSCTVVRDFADICYHSYPLYLKELRERSHNHQPHSIRYHLFPPCFCREYVLKGICHGVALWSFVDLEKFVPCETTSSTLFSTKHFRKFFYFWVSRPHGSNFTFYSF